MRKTCTTAAGPCDQRAALRERPEDVPLLADYFLSTYWVRHAGRARRFPRLTDAALRALCGYNWRGNVR